MGRMIKLAVALGMVSSLAAACSSQEVPEAACERDCGQQGSCAIIQGRQACLCDVGYEGEDCAQCTPGFVAQGNRCVADPCDPNPCNGPHQSACQVTNDGFECLCDDDAQDNDGDGTCRPSCTQFADRFPSQDCDDSSGQAVLVGPRSCQTVVTFKSDDPNLTQANIAGEFNQWRQDQAMTRTDDGSFQATLNLEPGDYAYKIYLPGSDTWLEDRNNPYTKYDGGIRNSRLRVEDCQQPLLRLMHEPETSAEGTVKFTVQFVQGSAGASPDAQGVRVTRNDAPVSAAFDAATGVVTIDDSGLAKGKYAYRFEVTDSAGRTAERLYVPVWVEESYFEWEDAVMYFVFTDRFLDGNPGNNAPVPGVDPRANWQGGDFEGLRQKLESGYFERLGVNALWISSISMNTQGAGGGTDGRTYTGYHSYWPISTGWTDKTPIDGVQPVDPHFGTLEEFKALVELAHSKGIRVLVDFVANHVHSDSPLWQSHQFDNPAWFHVPAQVCEDIGWTLPIECWFADYLPDFEYQNLDVMKRVADHAVWMVKETDIDGFRLDAVKHMINDFTYTLRGRVNEAIDLSGQRFYMVGETFTGEDGAEQLKQYVGPEQLDGQFDFPLYWQITSVFLRQERDLRALEGMLAWSEGFYGDFAVMRNFLGNHDVCRAVSHANGDFGAMWCNGGKDQGWNNPPGDPGAANPYDRLNLAWSFLMTAPGVPLIYYGDEFGMPGAGDPDNRRMMRFDDLNDHQRQTLTHVEKLAQIRHAHRALRRGQRQTLHMGGDGLTWAYLMSTPGDNVVVVLNRSDQPRSVSIDASGAFAAGQAPVEALQGLDFEYADGDLKVDLAPYQSAIFVLED